MKKTPVIGQSPAFLNILERVSRLAMINRPVLILGERGTGKELIAERLHYLSKRWDRPFLKVNCAILTDALLASELFGHEPGAFTGAIKKRLGRFEQAHAGSLFLDEIACASQQVQEALLRVVEYGEFERLGGQHTLQCDVRLICASNVDLSIEAKGGNFRADLLDRLSFEVLTLPPLRHRQEDILALADFYATNMATELSWETFPGFSNPAKQALMDYEWPGNVRELRNVVERAVYRWQAPLEPIDQLVFDPFDSDYRLSVVSQEQTDNQKQKSTATFCLNNNLKNYIENIEKAMIEKSLNENHYHQGNTAKSLGLSYHSLRAYIKKLKIKTP